MRHYLWSARCNTLSVNFTQKWQEINCNTLLDKTECFNINITFENKYFQVYAKQESF